MSQPEEPAIQVSVDITNPGQFFACCGLLELADRLWGGAEGWFQGGDGSFCLRPTTMPPVSSLPSVVGEIAQCHLGNTMTQPQLKRREELSAMSKKQRAETPSLEQAKKELDALWREAPVLVHEPFHLRIDWFADDRSGGSDLKTWAGQQSVVDIAREMKASVAAGEWSATGPAAWFTQRTNRGGVSFNFDSNLGAAGSDRDIGFSFDPLEEIRVRTRPLIELAAFVGLQRCRPLRIEKGCYRYSTWSEPLPPVVAGAACCGFLPSEVVRVFEFRLLYRTKYLKSFLPARPIGG